MTQPLLLLVGPEAEALAPRLEASGYICASEAQLAAETRPEALPDVLPDVLVVSRGWADHIGALRRRWGPGPLLLDVSEDTMESRVLCLSAGADDFWLSSLGPSDLLMRLRLHLDLSRRPTTAPPLLQLGDLVVNPGTRQVKRGTRPVGLTAREYQLMLLLLERKGAVVSRELILRHVWKDDQSISSNVIEVYVRYLRQKLEQAGERRLIHTVRGKGYCMSDRLPPLEPPS